MSDFIDACYNCGRFISLDEPYRETRNNFGYPMIVCEVCQVRNSDAVIAPEYLGDRIPNCSLNQKRY